MSKTMQKAKINDLWYFISNHLNVLGLLSTGIIANPILSNEKYYKDSRDIVEKRIPLFRKDRIPSSIIAIATDEQAHLRPCLLEFNLSSVTGEIEKLNDKSKHRKFSFEKPSFLKGDIALLAPSPFPVSLLTKIIFQTEEDKKLFIDTASDINNIDLGGLLLEVYENYFVQDTDYYHDSSAPRQGEVIEDSESAPETNINAAQSLGGAIAVLYHFSNRADIFYEFYRRFTSTTREDENNPLTKNNTINELSQLLINWSIKGEISDNSDFQIHIYLGLLKGLIKTRDRSTDFILQHLSDVASNLPEDTHSEHKKRLFQLIEDIKNLSGLSGLTEKELFSRYKGFMSRSIILMCLLDRCKALLEYNHAELVEEDYLFTAILFGVREGWERLPKSMRDPELSKYISYRMARFINENSSDNKPIVVFPEISAPNPIRALFPSLTVPWPDHYEKAAIDFAKTSGWWNCVTTVITPKHSDIYSTPIPESNNVIFNGVVDVAEIINKELFSKKLCLSPMQHESHINLRETLKKLSQNNKEHS